MGTPTVYDLANGEKLDIYDNDWLDKLIRPADGPAAASSERQADQRGAPRSASRPPRSSRPG